MLFYINDFDLSSKHTNYENGLSFIENKAIEMRNNYFPNLEYSGIKYGKNGKPYFEDKKLYFNGSDSSTLKVVCLSNINIGIDIEKLRKKNFLSISSYYFDKIEHETLLNSSDIEKDFFTIWTLKESFLKLSGSSILNLENTPCFDIKSNLYNKEKYYDKYSFLSFLVNDTYILSLSFESNYDKKVNIYTNNIIFNDIIYNYNIKNYNIKKL